MVNRLIVVLVVLLVLAGAQELGHAAAADPTGTLGYVRSLIAVMVGGVLVLAVLSQSVLRR